MKIKFPGEEDIEEILGQMAKTAKRRVKKSRPHQHMKSGGGAGKNKVNWTRIALITIGILIALSMLLSLVITPGTGSIG